MNRSQKLNYVLVGLIVGILGMWGLTATMGTASASPKDCTKWKTGTAKLGAESDGEPFGTSGDSVLVRFCSK